MTTANIVRFRPGKTVAQFIRSKARVRGIRGPIGSGKTSGALWSMINEIHGQPPMADGIRRARWLVTRNSYRELQDTTLKSFWDWFPQDTLGEWEASNMCQKIKVPGLEAEILFRSLDKPGSMRKLLSLELSGAYINEARELPLAVVQMVESRLGRYPAVRDGGSGRKVLLMDTNPPDAGHWWPRCFEREPIQGWQQYVQPSGMSAEAENIENLPPNYYSDLLAGKSEEWVNVYVHGRYGFLADGRPVYPTFAACVHAAERIEWNGSPVYVGLDFGLTPAAAIVQKTATGFQVIGEVVTQRAGAALFADLLRSYLGERFGGQVAAIWGDPAGQQAAQTNEETVFQVLRAKGIPAIPAPSQDALIRKEAVRGLLGQLTMLGQPALMVCAEKAPTLIKGMSGFYRYKRIAVGGVEDRFHEQPDKNEFSHVCEALEYCLVGLGQGSVVITRPESETKRDRAARDARRRIAVI